MSESLREANRLLIDKIRQRVDEASFAAFKQESGKFMRNQISAKEYFKKVCLPFESAANTRTPVSRGRSVGLGPGGLAASFG